MSKDCSKATDCATVCPSQSVTFQCSNDVLCTYMLTWLLKVLKEIFVLCKSAAHSQNAQESRCRNELECIRYHFPAYSKARVLSLQWKDIYKIPFSAFCALCFPFFCTRSLTQRDTHTRLQAAFVCVQFILRLFIKMLQTLVGPAVFYTDLCVVKHKSIAQDSPARCVKEPFMLCSEHRRIYLRERGHKRSWLYMHPKVYICCIRVNIALVADLFMYTEECAHRQSIASYRINQQPCSTQVQLLLAMIYMKTTRRPIFMVYVSLYIGS